MSAKRMSGSEAAAKARLKLEKVLRGGETWCRISFDESPLSMALIDRQLRFIKANKTFCRKTGFPEEKLQNYSLGDLMRPDEIRKTGKDRERLIRGALRKFTIETNARARNGGRTWVTVTVSAVRDTRGKFLCFLASVENIAERKRAEEALRESEERFRLSFEENTVGMAMVDRELTFIRANRAYCRMMGYTENELKTMKLSDVTHPDDFPRDRKQLALLAKGKLPRYQYEKKYRAKNGETVWGSVTVTVIRDKQGKFICTMGIVENITERKRAEEVLHEDKEQLRLTFGESPLSMAMIDRQLRFIKANKTFCRSTGFSEEELKKHSLRELVPLAELRKTRGERERLIKGEIRQFRAEWSSVSPAGETRWIAVTVGAIRDPHGKFLCFLAAAESITERKRAEEAMRESEKRFRLAFEKGPVGMVLYDREGRIIRANNVFCRIVGYPREKLLGRTFMELTHPDYVRADVLNKGKLLRGEIAEYRTEKQYIRKDGATALASLTVSVIRDERGKFHSFLAFVEDITARRHAEEASRESEKRFRLAFEENTVGMAMIDRTYRFVRVNRSFCRFLGYTEKELLKKKLSEVTHPDDYAPQQKILAQVTQGKLSRYHMEKRYVTKSGETVWGALTATDICDKNENFVCSMGIIENITERKRSEAALRESERRYRSIFENAPFGIFHATIEGKLIDVNAAYARHLGFPSPRECIAAINKTTIAERVYVQPGERQKFVRKTLLLGGWQQFENLYKRCDGQVMPGLLRFRAIPKDPATGAELEGFLEDLSVRKKAEEKVRLYQEKLRDLSLQLAFVEEKERQRLANNIHDYIGQSLSCAMLALGTLENEMPQTPKAQEALRKVREQIEEGIQYARSVTFELSPAILFKLGFEAVVEWLADRLLAPNNIGFRITGESSLKMPDTEARVILFRAVRELLMNVVKHAKAHEVQIGLRKNKGFLEITVQDDGKGFDILLLSKRTEGFGLFSVREQLMYIGGRMSIISQPGRGATVSVILPIEEDGRKKGMQTGNREGERYA